MPLRTPAHLLLIGLLMLPVGLHAVIFDPTSIVATSGLDGAQAVAVGDIDGDGNLDTVAAGGNGGTVIWLAQGPGTNWTSTVIDAALPGAVTVAIADLDRDGDLDVVAASNSADTLRWYENTAGDGSAWSASTITAAEDGVRAVAVADLDRDGDLDLVTAAAGADRIVWWNNNGSGGFTGAPTVIASAFDGAYALTLADVDGNGRIDVIGVANLADTVAVFYNASSDGSTWTAETVDAEFDAPTAVVVLDFYGVGAVDIAAAGGPTGAVIVWGQAPDGSWVGAAGYAFGNAPATALVVADLEDDGDVDLVRSASGTVASLEWLLNDHGNLLQSFAVGSLAAPASIAVGDLDADGDLEVVAAAPSTDTVAWFDNRAPHRSVAYTDGTDFSPNISLSITVEPADVNGDGRPDVVAAEFDAGVVAWWSPPIVLGDPWTKTVVSTTSASPLTLDVVDVDGDGDLDVLEGRFSPGSLVWSENVLGDGTVWTEHLIDPVSDAVRPFAGDFDADGDLDVLVLAQTTPRLAWWENTAADGSAWTVTTIDDTLGLPVDAGLADLNDDGRLDLVIADSSGDRLVLYESDGGTGTSWTRFDLATGFLDPRWIQAGDIDCDGDLDVVANSSQLGDVWWFANPRIGGGTWSGTRIDDAVGFMLRGDLADLNDDGDLDILVPNVDTDDVYRYENVRGDGTLWRRLTVDDNFDGAVDVRAVDIDRDGRLDIVGAANNFVPFRWWRNQGGSLTFATVDTAPSFMAEGVFDDVLTIDVTHQGLPGDVPVELRSLRVRFEESPGDPLDSTEAGDLFQAVGVVRDHPTDGIPGVLDPADPGAGSVFPLILDGMGDAHISMGFGEPESQVAVGEPARYFVVTLLEPDAINATPNQFLVTFLGDRPTAAIVGSDIEAPLEPGLDVKTKRINADLDLDDDGVGDTIDFCFGDNSTDDADRDGICADQDVDDNDPDVGLPLFRDGFESGDTSAWTVTVP